MQLMIMIRCLLVIILGGLGLWILLELMVLFLNPYGGLTTPAIIFGLLAVGLIQIIGIVSHREVMRLQKVD
jgi:hypothetical protein